MWLLLAQHRGPESCHRNTSFWAGRAGESSPGCHPAVSVELSILSDTWVATNITKAVMQLKKQQQHRLLHLNYAFHLWKMGWLEKKKNWEKQLLLEISLQNHCVVYTFQWKISWPANVSFRYFLVMGMGTWQVEDFFKSVWVICTFQVVGGILENEMQGSSPELGFKIRKKTK